MELDPTNTAAIAVICVFLIKELFAYLRTRNEGGGDDIAKAILQELQRQNNNHLTHLQEAIENGNRTLKESMHQDSMRIVEALGEIKGRLRG